MKNKLQIILAKTITIVVALGLMFSLILDAHQEQKQQAEKNSTIENNQTKKHTQIFFQSSKVMVMDSSVGTKLYRNEKIIGTSIMEVIIENEDENKSK